jgi:GTPase SAR1 family protein
MATPTAATTASDILVNYAKVVFSDLVDLSKRNPSVFDELYYGRETESTLFQTLVEDAHRTAVNIIIVGEAGVGKSNFIYNLVRHGHILDHLHIHPIMVDYRVAMPSNANGCLIQFLRDLRHYFEIIGHPINTLKDLNDDLITYNMQNAFRHLETLQKGQLKKHLLIVLDDFDYAEDEWFTMLDYFLKFATSDRASVVFTVRPLLLATIEKYDDRFTHYYVRDSQRIELQTIDIPRVLASRIALLLNQGSIARLYSRIANRVRGNCGGLIDVLAQMGITDINGLPKFDYPFTEKHNVFMRRITNGNLREVFDIATDSLIYMFDSRNKIVPRMEGEVERRSIGREGDLRIFYDAYDRKATRYKILDLHRLRSRIGNSLLFNVLELVKLREVLDDTFYEIAKAYGHLRKDVEYAIQELSDKTNRLIAPIRLRPARTTSLEFDISEYRITDKGNYYLQMCEWDEYKSRCGVCGDSIQRKLRP